MEYIYRREDNGELIRVEFEVMIRQDSAGYITLDDGVQARRCLHLEDHLHKDPRNEQCTGTRTIVSDALGVPITQLAEFERDRKKNGFRGVAFKQDPTEPTFYQVHCDSRAELDRYIKHRGYVNRNSIGGVRLSEDEMESARLLVERRYAAP